MEPISDGTMVSIGALAVSESDPNIIYVGEGEQTLEGLFHQEWVCGKVWMRDMGVYWFAKI